MKKALITGITGQDGAYLSRLLLSKGYEVHGIRRPSSTFSTKRLERLGIYDDLSIHYGDLTDSGSLLKVLHEVYPDEIYNLGAQSHVKISFDMPEYTADVDALGTLRLLEAIRTVGLDGSCRFYQASSSEMFGAVRETPQRETTPFHPRSPYGVSKLFAYWATVNYREAYGFHASNGILFNHESPLRGENFVTRKIVRGIVRIMKGLDTELRLGNLEARRDWGHAEDYVEAQWRILQQEKPDDYIIATGTQYSVRQFVQVVCDYLGIDLHWLGEGMDEVGYLNGRHSILIDPAYHRPAEVDTLLGDASKARRILNWEPRHDLVSLVGDMVETELEGYENE